MTLPDQFIAYLPTLVPLPQAVARAMELINDPKSNSSQIARAIEVDPALTTQLLRMANSAYYNAPRRLARVRPAVVRIGYLATREMLVSAGAWESLSQQRGRAVLPLEALWRHSVAAAYCARFLATEVGGSRPGHAYTAGLLHDVGLHAIAQFAPERLRLVLGQAALGRPLVEAEAAELGFDHAEAGAKILEHWGLARASAQAVRWHHQPAAALADERLVAILHLADALAQSSGAPIVPDLPPVPADAGVVARLGLRLEDLEAVQREARIALSRTQSTLRMPSQRLAAAV